MRIPPPQPNPFRAEVEAAFAAVMARKLLQITRSESEPAFGNGFVVFAAEGFRLRVVRDRGDVSLQVAGPDAPLWLQLPQFINVAMGKQAVGDRLADLAAAARLADRSYDLVRTVFAEPPRRRQVEHQLTALNQMLKKRQPKPPE